MSSRPTVYQVASATGHFERHTKDMRLRQQPASINEKEEKAKKKPYSDYEELCRLGQKDTKLQEECHQRPGHPPKFPEDPDKDPLPYLSRYAPPLQPWQRGTRE